MTHDYLKDEQNLWNIYRAINSEDPDYADKFEPVHTFISDGTNVVYECLFDDSSVRVLRQHVFHKKDSDGVSVRLDQINEMEFVGDKIWANIFLSTDVYVLDMDKDIVDK